jgi:hypothetical protein
LSSFLIQHGSNHDLVPEEQSILPARTLPPETDDRFDITPGFLHDGPAVDTDGKAALDRVS